MFLQTTREFAQTGAWLEEPHAHADDDRADEVVPRERDGWQARPLGHLLDYMARAAAGIC